jgi:hypothetical protein
MRSFLLLTSAAAVMAAAGCARDHGVLMSGPEIELLRLAVPDREYRLTPADRGKVRIGFDIDALERLIGMIRPDMREEILKNFQIGEPGERDRGWLVEFSDPGLQPVLEEVYAPMWDDVSDEDLLANVYGLPGREVAMQRREARRRARQQGENPPE